MMLTEWMTGSQNSGPFSFSLTLYCILNLLERPPWFTLWSFSICPLVAPGSEDTTSYQDPDPQHPNNRTDPILSCHGNFPVLFLLPGMPSPLLLPRHNPRCLADSFVPFRSLLNCPLLTEHVLNYTTWMFSINVLPLPPGTCYVS